MSQKKGLTHFGFLRNIFFGDLKNTRNDRLNSHRQGFTLIELLVVIAIIGLLSSVVLASLSTARVKAREVKRVSDMKNIHQALQLYQDRYGCIPITLNGSTCGVVTGLGFSNSGSWDYSSQGDFLPFLATGTEPIMPVVPVDPINNMTGDMSPANSYAYQYYCYPGQGLALGYYRETPPWGRVWYGVYRDPDFTCK